MPKVSTVHADLCPVLVQLSMVRAILATETGQPLLTQDTGKCEEAPTAEQTASFSNNCLVCGDALTVRGMSKHMQKKHAHVWRDIGSQVVEHCTAWATSIHSPCQHCGSGFKRAVVHSGACFKLFHFAFSVCFHKQYGHRDYGRQSDGFREGALRGLRQLFTVPDGSQHSGNGGGRPGAHEQEEEARRDVTARRQALPTKVAGQAGTIKHFFKGLGAASASDGQDHASSGRRTAIAEDRETIRNTHGDRAARDGPSALCHRQAMESGKRCQSANNGQIVEGGIGAMLHCRVLQQTGQAREGSGNEGQHDQASLCDRTGRQDSVALHGVESRGAGAAAGHHEAGHRAPGDGGDRESCCGCSYCRARMQ